MIVAKSLCLFRALAWPIAIFSLLAVPLVFVPGGYAQDLTLKSGDKRGGSEPAVPKGLADILNSNISIQNDMAFPPGTMKTADTVLQLMKLAVGSKSPILQDFRDSQKNGIPPQDPEPRGPTLDCSMSTVGPLPNGAWFRPVKYSFGSDQSIFTQITDISSNVNGSYHVSGHALEGYSAVKAFRFAAAASGPFPSNYILPSVGFDWSFAHGISSNASTVVGAGCRLDLCFPTGDDSSSLNNFKPKALRWPGPHTGQILPRPVEFGGGVPAIDGDERSESAATNGNGLVAVGTYSKIMPSEPVPGGGATYFDPSLLTNATRWAGLVVGGSTGNLVYQTKLIPVPKLTRTTMQHPAMPTSEYDWTCSYSDNSNPNFTINVCSVKSFARAVSDNGSKVVGTYYLSTVNLAPTDLLQQRRASVWNIGNASWQPVPLFSGMPADNTRRGIGRGISPDGSEVVGSDHNNSTTITALPVLYPELEFIPFGYYNGKAYRNLIALTYRTGSNAAQMGSLASGYGSFRDSNFNDASNMGAIRVGSSYTKKVFYPGVETQYRSAVISPAYSVSGSTANYVTIGELQSHLQSRYGLNINQSNPRGARWQLTDATAISPDGKMVVGELHCYTPEGEKPYVASYIARMP